MPLEYFIDFLGSAAMFIVINFYRLIKGKSLIGFLKFFDEGYMNALGREDLEGAERVVKMTVGGLILAVVMFILLLQ